MVAQRQRNKKNIFFFFLLLILSLKKNKKLFFSPVAPPFLSLPPHPHRLFRLSFPSLLRVRLAHGVERRPGLEPRDLVVVEGVVDGELVLAPIGPLADELERHAGRKRREAEHRDLVERPDLVVVGRVGERQRQQALLLQVGLVDARERLDDDCQKLR